MHAKHLAPLLFTFVFASNINPVRGDAITLDVSIQGIVGPTGTDNSFSVGFSSSIGPDTYFLTPPYGLFSAPYSSLLPKPNQDSQGDPIDWFNPNPPSPQYLNYQGPLDLTVTLSTDGTSGTPDVATIHYTGDMSGRFSSLTMGGEVSGGAGATVTSAQLVNWSPNSSIPLWAIEPWLHPENISIDLVASGGASTTLYGTFMLVNRVPEPSTLAFTGLIAITAVASRRLRRKP